ncbi:MAG: DUF397 domain-containing protein [Pseudonocardiales bacterium]|nr:DUF397 domain-containing protein [Pseudonocardiales bacterium]
MLPRESVGSRPRSPHASGSNTSPACRTGPRAGELVDGICSAPAQGTGGCLAWRRSWGGGTGRCLPDRHRAVRDSYRLIRPSADVHAAEWAAFAAGVRVSGNGVPGLSD